MPLADVFTNESAILNGIVDVLTSVQGLSQSSVFIAADLIWLDAPPGDQYVEIIPGAAIDTQAEQQMGVLQDLITVAVFKRIYSDQAQRDTARIADASRGLLALVATIESALINNYLKGLCLLPVLPEHREAPERAPVELQGWVAIRRVFKLTYQYDFPLPQNQS